MIILNLIYFGKTPTETCFSHQWFKPWFKVLIVETCQPGFLIHQLTSEGNEATTSAPALQLLLHYIRLMAFFSRTTWVSQHQKGKPFWIWLEQEMLGWQWHQLDHMQIICTSLQRDKYASTSPLKFFTGRMPFLPPNQQCQTTGKQLQLQPLLQLYKVIQFDAETINMRCKADRCQ